jgi:hypothetical protein
MVLIDKTDAALNVRKLGAILPILNSEAMLVSYEGEAAGNRRKFKLAIRL